MSLEEKMLERFTKERQRASKGTAYTLEDDDDLTHYGQSLSNMDDFDEAGLRIESDDDEEEGSGIITFRFSSCTFSAQSQGKLAKTS